MCNEISYKGICDNCKEKINYIEDPRCLRCGKPLDNDESEYCMDCRKIKNDPIEAGRSLWVHKAPVSTAVYAFKYKNKRYYGEIFAEELFDRFSGLIRYWNIDTIIPIPIHKKRLKKRGYNQAKIIAKRLGELSGIPVVADKIIRKKNTKPQKELNDIERIKNIKDAFEVQDDFVPSKAVLVIDDIYTTGNTIRQFAQILKDAGVEKVFFFTISIGQGI